MSLKRTTALLAFAFISLDAGRSASGDDLPADSPRMTPLVRVIQQIEPAVAALFTPLDNEIASGSGTVIHPEGFVLTNNHVLPKNTGHALLSDGRPLQFRVVGRLPERDIAVVQLLGARTPLPVIPLGRSHNILNGETVVVAGNPGGRGTVYTAGIVSSREVLEGGPNALVMTNYKTDARDKFIQFDAASNRGNSGGPLINMDGELVGIVSALVPLEQNVGLAIPVDRVWERFGEVMESELLLGVSTGIVLNPLTMPATVASVAQDSAAADAGVQAGDVISAVNKRPIRHSVDWQLALLFEAKPDQPLTFVVQRADEKIDIELQVRRDEGLPAATVEDPAAGMQYKLYHGEFSFVPDFAKLTAAREGIVPTVNLDAMRHGRDDAFALSVTGFLKISADGIYRLIVLSDDGSRVFVNDHLVIDNDGNHPPKQAGKRIRLKAGFHPIRIEHFEGNGSQALQLAIEMPDGTGREVSADMLFHRD